MPGWADGWRGSCIVAWRVRILFALLGSLLIISIVSIVRPFFAAVDIFAEIAPFSPGFRWLELAITAAHPHDVLMSLMIRSFDPVLLKTNVNSNCSPSDTHPKSCFSVWNSMDGSDHARTGNKTTAIKSIFFMAIV